LTLDILCVTKFDITVRNYQRCVMGHKVNEYQRSLLASIALSLYEIHS